MFECHMGRKACVWVNSATIPHNEHGPRRTYDRGVRRLETSPFPPNTFPHRCPPMACVIPPRWDVGHSGHDERRRQVSPSRRRPRVTQALAISAVDSALNDS